MKMAEIKNCRKIDIDKLVPYERNAKLHPDEQIKAIARSIQKFGFLNPVLIDENHNIIAGHGRVEAAKRLGLKTVPFEYVEGLTEEERKAYILADNKLTEMGGWDMDLVSQELQGLKDDDFDINLTGFNIDDIIIENDEPETPNKELFNDLQEERASTREGGANLAIRRPRFDVRR